MIVSEKNTRMLAWGGLLSWLAVGGDHLRALWEEPALIVEPSRLLCTLGFVAFGASYVPVLLPRRSPRQRIFSSRCGRCWCCC